MKNYKSVIILITILLSSWCSLAQTRTEKDLLGEKQIPVNAYYGVQTIRALENFQVSSMKTNFFPDYVRAYAME
jgi:aspartate ammonia-lyase